METITAPCITCLNAGMILSRDRESFRKASPVIFRENLKGIITDEELKVPSSELGMATRAADKDIFAFALVGNTFALVVHDNGAGGCAYLVGTEYELLSPTLRTKAKDMYKKHEVP